MLSFSLPSVLHDKRNNQQISDEKNHATNQLPPLTEPPNQTQKNIVIFRRVFHEARTSFSSLQVVHVAQRHAASTKPCVGPQAFGTCTICSTRCSTGTSTISCIRGTSQFGQSTSKVWFSGSTFAHPVTFRVAPQRGSGGRAPAEPPWARAPPAPGMQFRILPVGSYPTPF